MTDVSIYLRKSRLEDETETMEDTLARHERILTDFCKRNNYNVIKTYKEVVSGENLENRPRARALLEDVAANLYDGVVVVDLDRLSRGNPVDQTEILEIFKKSNTKIYTLNKTYDLSSDNDFDEDFFEFGLFMSRREYKIIKRRLMRGKTQAQKEGYYVNSRLVYGYHKERKGKGCVLIPYEPEAQVVKTIFNKFVNEDMLYTEICKYLEDNGIKSALDAKWQARMVKKILLNKTYIGLIHYNARDYTGDNWYQGLHEPIIDEELFNKAQEKIKLKKTRLTKRNLFANPLASLVECELCGATMQLHPNADADYITCRTRGCATYGIRLYELEALIIAALKEELKGFRYELDNMDESVAQKIKARDEEISLLKSELLKKESMIDKACELLELGVYSLDKYKDRVSKVEIDIKNIKDNIKALENRCYNNELKLESAIPIIERCLEEYHTLEPKAKNDILKEIIEKIYFYKTIKNTKADKTLSNEKIKMLLKL